ncbi:hypothetical protein YC2023_039218 [Brassica napus]
MFWPCEIWGKYVDKLEDLKSEENSSKAVQCLNDMVTNALVHIEDCMKYMDALRDPAIFRLCAIPQDISCMLKAKVDKNCPNSSSTLTRLEAVQKVCRDSGVLHKRKSYIRDEVKSNRLMTVTLVLILAIILFAYHKDTRVTI